MRRRREEEEPARDAPHHPRSEPVHELLRLQNAAGNQATAAHGHRFRHPPGSHSPHRSTTAEFGGQTFRAQAGGTLLMQAEAASGRPVSVRSGDARTCRGATGESYKNNARYVGIPDFSLVDPAEQLRMIGGGSFTDPLGAALHGGDWGAGRVPLHPVHVVPAPRGCGNTAGR